MIAEGLAACRTRYVVDPIVSLIDDQIENLSKVGFDRCIGITSALDFNTREDALALFSRGQYLSRCVAPERFQTQPPMSLGYPDNFSEEPLRDEVIDAIDQSANHLLGRNER